MSIVNQVMKAIKPAFAFVDVENMRNSAKAFGYQDFNYEKLFEWLVKKKGVTRVYLYTAVEKGDASKMAYFQGLKSRMNEGFFVEIKEVIPYKGSSKTHPCRCPKCQHSFGVSIVSNGKKKGNCDAEYTLDIIRFGVRGKYSKIYAFSGDGDFSKVYEYVASDLKKEVVVYAPSGSILGKRTSLKIKQLALKGTVKLESTNGLFQHFGRK